MPCLYSINELAHSYADRKTAGLNLNEQGRRIAQNRAIYDYKVIGFNLTTIATIVIVALAVFTASQFLVILAFLTYNARGAFMRSVDFEHQVYMEGLPVQWADRVRCQLLDFRVWMKTAPAVDPALFRPDQPPPAPQQPAVPVPRQALNPE
ncbi:MAG TPA: hypothetical protein VLF94_04655 [Chlamydiales bacterium]|nr:hypothetical protein [Chlamydiales bacterium]